MAISNQSFIRILVVDDLAAWRRCLIEKMRAEGNFQVVAVATDGLEAIRKAEELQPDLILLDVGLPKLDGIRAAREIRKVAPESKILFLSQELDPTIAGGALSAGGHGYVVKSAAVSDLAPAMRAVMHGETFLSPTLLDPKSKRERAPRQRRFSECKQECPLA